VRNTAILLLAGFQALATVRHCGDGDLPAPKSPRVNGRDPSTTVIHDANGIGGGGMVGESTHARG
jgi:hypothetical protein